ncbi:MAG: DNA gyrase subunit A [Rikenellaceae bacterium]
MAEGEKIIKINIEEEMKTAYIDYSMSVIVSRALPDVRDGLKPIHRRILYMCNELNLYSDKAYKKSARIVGEVMGKFHPHGDSSIYEAMVRMAQPWSMRYPLVDGQGNFGSIDGDSPAAMRYTEARLQKITDEAMADIDKKTVDYTLNFDDTIEEPTVLPTKLPLLMLNGTSGIAVGMATNMPPHNLGNVVDAVVAYIDNNDIEISELIKHVKAPDFPTGATIYGYEGVKEAYETGRGRIVLRAKTEIEILPSGRECIVVTEIPYQVNKAEMIRKIADLINDKKIEGIDYINDESDRQGMRIVIIVKRDAMASVVLNTLFKHTSLQSSFSVNSIALADGRPRMVNLKDQISFFVSHRHDVVLRRLKFDLDKAQSRAHIVEGLLIAQDNIDEVVNIIRSSQTPDDARGRLQERFGLSEIQASAIIDMRLRSLIGLEREKLQSEYNALMETIEEIQRLLADTSLQMELIKTELIQTKEKYNDERRTDIVYASGEFNPEDFYADDEVVITISHLGYIKRTLLSEYRTQSRGGVGAKGSATRDADFIEHIYVTTMHNTMLFFTEGGRCFWLKVYEIPEGSRASKGRALQNVIENLGTDKVKAYINVRRLDDEEYVKNNYIIMCTKKGTIKKSCLEEYSRPRRNGVNAITIKDGDELLEAKLTSGEAEIILGTKEGKAIRFNEQTVRIVGRTSQGVKGVTIEDGNEVIGMITFEKDLNQDILCISENGYGKRSDVDDYRITNRGGKGVKALQVTERTGSLISLQSVSDENDLMIINKSGVAIRIPIATLRVTGRATQGVKVINLRGGDTIASVVAVPKSEEEEEIQPTIDENGVAVETPIDVEVHKTESPELSEE